MQYFDNFDSDVKYKHDRDDHLRALIEKLSNLENIKIQEAQKAEKQKIAIIQKDATDLIWEDKGSGANMDGSFYRYNKYAFVEGRDRNGNILKDFRLLGDTACSGYNHCEKSLLVKDISDSGDILKRPDKAYPVYVAFPDMGSLIRLPAVIWWKLDMNHGLFDSPGYQCLGDAITTTDDYKSNMNPPNLEAYRCVKEEFLEKNTRSFFSHVTQFFSRLNMDQVYLSHALLKG